MKWLAFPSSAVQGLTRTAQPVWSKAHASVALTPSSGLSRGPFQCVP
jgi:hypothetical protein